MERVTEYNGIYWHSEAAGKPNTYHRDKSRMSAAAGYQLIHIWEDDWKQRPEQVIRTLAHKLGATARLTQVLPQADPGIAARSMARKLTCAQVDGTRAHHFLEQNHIQGPVSATRHFALLQDQQVRALLSLRSPRGAARMNRQDGHWEIQRYASCGVVAGGFTRLLRYAERTLKNEGVQLTRWISFSADDISDGGLYRSAGFIESGQHRPDYRYVCARTRWTRMPKEGFQRKRFRDDPTLAWQESWTEHQAAVANGLYRIYDAGKTRWVKDLTP